MRGLAAAALLLLALSWMLAPDPGAERDALAAVERSPQRPGDASATRLGPGTDPERSRPAVDPTPAAGSSASEPQSERGRAQGSGAALAARDESAASPQGPSGASPLAAGADPRAPAAAEKSIRSAPSAFGPGEVIDRDDGIEFRRNGVRIVLVETPTPTESTEPSLR